MKPAPVKGRAESEADIELSLLVEAHYRQYHYDFRGLRARVAGPPQRRGDECARLFQPLATAGPGAARSALFTTLLDYLTVQVSEMFRDPAYFRALRERVVPLLRTYPSLKIWVAGCSTGEEAYSLAILLAECGLLERSLIYATDINAEALRKAGSRRLCGSTASPASPRTTAAPAPLPHWRAGSRWPTIAPSSTPA